MPEFILLKNKSLCPYQKDLTRSIFRFSASCRRMPVSPPKNWRHASACRLLRYSERLKRLESGGYIKRYIAVLDAGKLNQGFVVFCKVKMQRLSYEIATEFARIIRDIPEVTECYNISGAFDYLLKIHASDMKHYQEFILNVLGRIDHLGSLESVFVMDELKHEYGIHL